MSAHGEVHELTREEIIAGTAKPIPARLKTISLVLAVIGIVVFAIGAFMGVDRVWQALHVNWLYFTSISSAGVMFVAVQRITTARWSRNIIRLLEGFVAFLPVALVLLVLIFIGKSHIFPWMHHTPPMAERELYLQPTFVVTRDLIMFGIITVLSVWYIYTCVRLDVGIVPEGGASWAAGIRARMRRGFREERREIHSTHSLQGRLAVFLALAFGLFWMMLAFDLSMSLDTSYYSTMYGWWFFMGGWIAALCLWTILVMAWRKHLGREDMITETHFHDLGKLCFAFTAFWGYLSFGQYLIIWYGNLTEETHWYTLRLTGVWVVPSMIAVSLMFLPFFGLLSRAAKVYLPTMAFFAACSVAGLWIHRYAEVYPSIYGVIDSLPFGGWELGVTVGMLGIWAWCYMQFMDAFPRMRVMFITSPHRDEVQVPCNPKTMEPLPAHE